MNYAHWLSLIPFTLQLGGMTPSPAVGEWDAWCLGKRRLVVEWQDNLQATQTDTLSPPGGMYTTFDGLVEGGRESAQGRFVVTTWNSCDSTRTYWILDATEKRFWPLLKRHAPLYENFGAVVIACHDTRVLVSVGRSYLDKIPTVPSVTYLLDADTGSVLREWRGLFLGTASRTHLPRYDDVTSAIWIVPTHYAEGSWLAEDAPERIIRVYCGSDDTTRVSERWLLGEDLNDYHVPDIYRGHMLVETTDGLSEEEMQSQILRTLLVDLVNRKVVGEWRRKWDSGIHHGYRSIAQDLQGIMYTEEDSTGVVVGRRLLRIGETQPIEVN